MLPASQEQHQLEAPGEQEFDAFYDSNSTSLSTLEAKVSILEQRVSKDGLTTSTTLTLDIPEEEETTNDQEASKNLEETKKKKSTRLSSRGRPIRLKEEVDLPGDEIQDDARAGRKTAASKANARRLKGSAGYRTYSPELRARIGRFALENGNQKTIEHFLRTEGVRLPESTVRNIRDKYIV